MNKNFWIFLAAGLAVVGGLIFTLLTATQGSRVRLTGKILKVRALDLPGSTASIVIVDFRAANPSNVPFVTGAVTLRLQPSAGAPVDGTTISKSDIENLFQYEKLLGPKFNNVFSLQDRIAAHQSMDLMAGARFELSEAAVSARKAILLRIEDVDGAVAELRE